MLDEKKVIVTGGVGFLGTHLVNSLLRVGVTKDNVFVPRSKDYDLRNIQDIKRMYDDFQADIVIHSASRTGGIGFYSKYPATLFYDNLMMGLQLMEQSRLRNFEKFVLIGSGVMYPTSAKIPLQEENIWNGYPDEDAASYGLFNRALLAQSQQYRKEFNFNSIFLIPANLYGPGDYFEPEKAHVIPSLISKFYKAKEHNDSEIEISGSRETSREFLYVEDAAKLIILATEKYNSLKPLNLGTGESTPLEEIVKIISWNIGYKGRINWNVSQQKGASKRCFDISNLKRIFGKQEYTSLIGGIQNTISWYLKNKD